MSRVVFAPEVAEDFERIIEHLLQNHAGEVETRMDEIVRAIDVLRSNPAIGRPARRDLRELVIGRGARGYVAIYRYIAELDAVFVLAIRAQSESGYARF